MRACLAAVRDGRILLVPHYDPEAGPVQWKVPGGSVRLGESVRKTAVREFDEETGFQAQATGPRDVSEVIVPARP
jgi:ADP-ribose pyrophosphatase YjhB (NUDIX family)